jgi:protease-4
MDEKSKYFGYGIVGGIAILLIVFLIATLIPIGVDALTPDTIAVIPVHGEISYNNESNTVVTNPNTFESMMNKANSDDKVAAIVLDVDSDGGSLVATQEILSSINQSSKPVVAWIGDSGSSCGYLVSTGANTIIASPNSAVGNIGFKLSSADLSNYYSKLGINANTSKGNTFNTISPNYYSLSSSQKIMIKNLLYSDSKYSALIVSDNRHLDNATVNTFINGGVYTGNSALSNHLIDGLGTQNQAIKIAANEANLTSYNVVKYDGSTNLSTDSFTNIKNALTKK